MAIDLSAVVLALAPCLAEHLYTAWRRRKGKTDQQAKNLRELIKRDHQNQLLQKKIERDVEALAEHIVESLEPIFELDGATLTSSELSAVTDRLAEVVRSAGISPKFLLERRLDPLLVARAYKKILPTAHSLMSERQSAFFDACIEEIARRLVALADQLPGFGTDLASELLRTQGLILSQGKTIIQTLVEFSEANKSKQSYLLNNFDLRFAHAVRHRFGDVQILGLDPDLSATRLSLNTSYISLRVETRSKKRRTVAETEVSSEAILHHSKRALIRGHAGSGKTTLLQWIAVQCVDKALPPPAEIFNGHAPLMVRLRDFHGRPLPKGHELLSTTSSALAELDPGDWFKDRLHRGRFIFLIDGLDEVSEDQRREVARWLEDLTLASPNSSFLVTTRPSAVDQDYLSKLDFDEYFLKPMTPAEVHLFVDYWHEAVSEVSTHDTERKALIDQKRAHLTRLLEENRDLVRLSATPLLCAVICTLNLDGRLQLISDRVDLYRTASELLYHDRDKKKEISDPIYTSLNRKQKEKILSYIAYQFIKNGISSTDVKSISEMVMRSRGLEPSEEGKRQAKALADAIILRSGIINEVGVNTVQFLHKTFQEYFAALEVVYQQDEIHVAKDFDLKSWGELYLIVLSIAPRGVAAEMVRIVFERAGSSEKDWAAYVLLAGAGCREVPEVDADLKQNVSEQVEKLIPPQELSTVYQLAEMGGLVLPFLRFRYHYSPVETDHIVTLLGLIEDSDSEAIIEEYAAKADLSLATVESFLRALDYKGDDLLTKAVIAKLKARNSVYFWRPKPRARLYVGSKAMLRYSDMLPEVGWLILDARGNLGINEALGSDWRGIERIRRLSIVSAGNFVGSKLGRFKGLQEMDFVESFVEDTEFFSLLRRLKVVRLIDSELADWGSLEYAEVERLYIAGESVVEAVIEERMPIMRGARKVFLGLDCIRGIERLERTRFDRFDTWGVAVWDECEIRGLREELGGS